MMSRANPPLWHLLGRALAVSRVPFSLLTLRKAVSSRRLSTSNRFQQPSVWLRFVALGVLLVDLALLTLAKTQLDRNIDGYWPGMGSVFAGLLIGIIIMRLARPRIYFDWIAVAALKIALGLMLAADPLRDTFIPFAQFSLLFTMLSGLKLWIGLTLPQGKAAASLLAGGFASLFCAMTFMIDYFVELGIGAETVLAIDLIVTGFSIIAFGLALRPIKSETV